MKKYIDEIIIGCMQFGYSIMSIFDLMMLRGKLIKIAIRSKIMTTLSTCKIWLYNNLTHGIFIYLLTTTWEKKLHKCYDDNK